MSHITVQATKPGQPMFSDLDALRAACELIGLKMEKRSNYTWFNRVVGDYPLPEGVTAEQLGKNAEYVLSLSDEMRRKHGSSHTAPYEIGIVRDPNNPGCYVPMYDFWMGGFGLEKVVGAIVYEDDSKTQIKMLCPILKQHYEMCADARVAQSVGDNIRFMSLKEAKERYPQHFKDVDTSVDENTWVSVADTEMRVPTSM